MFMFVYDRAKGDPLCCRKNILPDGGIKGGDILQSYITDISTDWKGERIQIS